jgi:hypothetical protein
MSKKRIHHLNFNPNITQLFWILHNIFRIISYRNNIFQNQQLYSKKKNITIKLLRYLYFEVSLKTFQFKNYKTLK